MIDWNVIAYFASIVGGLVVVLGFIIQAIKVYRAREWEFAIKKLEQSLTATDHELDNEIEKNSQELRVILHDIIAINKKIESLNNQGEAIAIELAARKYSEVNAIKDLSERNLQVSHKTEINRSQIEHLQHDIRDVKTNLDKLTGLMIKMIQHDR